MGVKRVFFWVCIFLTDYPNREWLIVPDRYFGLRQWEVLFFFFFCFLEELSCGAKYIYTSHRYFPLLSVFPNTEGPDVRL